MVRAIRPPVLQGLKGMQSMKVVIPMLMLSLFLVTGPVMGQAPKAAPAQPAPQAEAPRPFPQGATIAYVDLNLVATQSKEGQAAGQKIRDFQARKQAELEGRQKALQAAQTKLEQGGALLSESARAQQAKEVERLQVDLQRASQDANQEVGEFTQDLQVEFQQKLLPIISQVATAKGLLFIFSIADSGVVYADQGLNVTSDVVAALDAATSPAASAAASGAGMASRD
jgi:outer membrane protein